MRSLASFLLVLSLAAASAAPCRGADGALKFEGNWRLVVQAFGEDEFMVIGAKSDKGEPTAEVKSAQPFLRDARSGKGPEVASVKQQGDELTIEFKLGGDENPFTGKLVKEGPKAGQVLGTFKFQGRTFPARLQKNDSDKVAPLQPSQFPSQVNAARQDFNLKNRLERLKALVDERGGAPPAHMAYPYLLLTALDAKQSDKELKAIVDQWLAGARPYGEGWVAETWMSILNTLGSRKDHADLELELLARAQKELESTASTEMRADLVKLEVTAAKRAGKDDLASAAQKRLETLEKKLDEEYLANVPPFKPDTYGGRKDAQNDRVVLLELFTGAQCPPCVAADVAFDALSKTYKPTDLVLLQYHLHIPGPDPMTNTDTMKRGDYYDVNSTPSAFFNGRAQKGGGYMQHSRMMYEGYRQLVDADLEHKKQASIDLNVKRTGDELHITARATTDPKAGTKGALPWLRLALVEESVHYAGNNKLRYHHHVVRALPGGAQGKEVADGKATADVTVNLADLRKELEKYVTDFDSKRGFPGTIPPIEMKDLAVVAFVQDDNDKSVWHAVTAPVSESN